MPFDEDPSHGDGPNDPRHNREHLSLVAGACVEMATLNAKANDLCERCVRNIIIGRLLISEFESIRPEKRAAAAEHYRGLMNQLLDSLAKLP
jgi:hypothetical protein